MYSPKQVSKMLGIPGSSLRRYAETYKEFFSESAQPGKEKRWYTSEDCLVLRKIRILVAQHKGPSEIRRLIPIMSDIPNQPTNALSLVPEIQERFDHFSADIAKERTEREKLSDLIDRRLDAIEAWYALPWWKRLFKRPPKSP